MHAIAKKRWELFTNLPSDEFILFADELLQETGDRLDSLDLGDALGAMVSIAESEEYSGNLEFHNSLWRWNHDEKYVLVYLDGFDLFEWDFSE